MRRRRSRWGADGTDGIDPHNRFTIEPNDRIQKKMLCESCNENFILSDLSENYVCRGCRGLGTREEEAKKREKLIKKERRRIKKEERKENEKKEEEKRKMREKGRKKLTKAIESSNFIILFEYLVEQRWVFQKLVKEKELIDLLLSELKMLRTVKSEKFREILEVICSKSGKTKYFRELLPELFLTLFINYPELLTNADKGFDHWVKYERENILDAINNIDEKEFGIIRSMVDQKTIRTMRYTMWHCYGMKKHKYGRDIGLYLEGTIPEKCPSCGNNSDMKSTYRANSWSEYTLKEFDSLLNKRI